MGLFDGLRRNIISPDDEADKVATIERDLKPDVNVTDFAYMQKGLFRLGWKRKGDLPRDKITFLRRNEPMMSIRYVHTSGRITMDGTIIAENQPQQLAATRLTMNGQLRVRTAARVAEQNATRVNRSGAMAVYTWETSRA